LRIFEDGVLMIDFVLDLELAAVRRVPVTL
jgi:hypothetical protein